MTDRTINKIISKSPNLQESLLDLTSDSVSPENLLLNETAHNNEGEGIVGMMPEGGTSDYDALSNRPQINSNLLTGNKTGGQLGLQNKNLDSPIPIGGQTANTVEGALSALNGKKADIVGGKVPVNELPVFVGIGGSTLPMGGIVPEASAGDEDKYLRSDGTWAKPAGGGGGVSNYDDLTNRPKVNGTTLSGDKTGTQLGLQNVILSSTLSIGGQTVTEVEEALGSLADISKSMTGATSSAAGEGGFVPSPSAGDENKALFGDGTWKPVSGGGGGGEGDMKKSVYDSDLSVANAGGIGAFVSDAVSGKVDKVAGKGLSTNDYSDTEKGKVADNTGAIEAITDVYGAKNVLPFDLNTIKALNTAGTWNGNAYTYNEVTFTVNTDSKGSMISVTADGTATPLFADLFIIPVSKLNSLISGNYILSGCPIGGSESTYFMFLGGQIYDVGNEFLFSTPIQGTNCGIRINAGYTANNLTFYPMIRDARIADPTYAPYAMTNRELTEGKLNMGKVLTSSDNLNNVMETGLYIIGSSTPANSPENTNWCSLLVNKVANNNVQQQLFKGQYLYQRKYSGASPVWESWYKFTGTVVS